MTFARLPLFKHWRATACAVLAAAIVGMTSAASATEDRSLALIETTANRPYTNIEINGVRTTALIDTGATIPLIPERYLDAERIADTIEDEARILGIGGQKYYPVTRLQTLSAGAEGWSDLRIAVNTENKFPIRRSVLPISIIDARVVDFDFPNHKVHLYDESPKRVRRTRRSWISYQEVNDLIFIPVRINGVRGRALIDTGADVSFVNPAFAEDTKARIDEVRTAMLRGSDLSSNRVSIHTFRRIYFAENKIDEVALPVLETDLFAELGFVDQPMMILGMDVLGQFRMQVDRDKKRVYFLRSRKPLRRYVNLPAGWGKEDSFFGH